ncbi:MAG: Na+/H+ antiporter NhaA [Myxococcaceae bacterium]|nr:Na+/H+ antiporter NhaA [Myxococcaceae bacterium]
MPSLPPSRLKQALRRVSGPLERFVQLETASGIILLAAAAIALAWANSPWASSYASFWQTTVAAPGPWGFTRSLEWIVNDGLMVIFFFVVGMEIRREMHSGSLASLKQALLPTVAALGGMAVPALIYLLIAGAPSTRSGWGVPMATDIAFALGVVALLGSRVPARLRVLLLALAVIDDLGAILVIALFYSSGVSLVGLAVAAAAGGAIVAMRRFVSSPWAYIVPALVMWGGVYSAGIHPTIAGVIVGLLTPVKAPNADTPSVADRLIESLHSYVAFLIMPLFALANAGVRVAGVELDADASRTLIAVSAGLLLGKPLGVVLLSTFAVRLKWAVLPVELNVRHLWVLGVIAGIGFTMSLFVAALAFTDANLLAAAKLGVLIASATAGILGLLLGRVLLQTPAASA